MPMITAAETHAKCLTALLAPRSVAVIGASREPGSVGYAILRNILDGEFRGPVYPVNPKATEILGVPCLHSVDELPEAVDLAVIVVGARLVPAILEACGRKGVKGAVVISAGFKEVGAEGAALETQVREVISRFNLPVIGPNCLGLLNTDPSVRLNATFAKEMPATGRIGFISQSGALCTAVLEYAKAEGIGFSKVISMGNKVDVDELDLLTALHNDPATRVILLYLEDLSDGKRFIEVVREITGEGPGRKPILAVKSGRTPEGAKAAGSHTGALAGRDEVYDAVFAQAGVLRVDSVDELFDYALGFAHQPLPKGRRVAIVTNAGGPGIMTTDACVRYGLEVARLEPKTIETIRPHVPPTAALQNPVDVIGDARHDRYEVALRAVLDDPNVDSAIVLATPQAMTNLADIAQVIAQVAKTSGKPVVASFMGVTDLSSGIKVLDAEQVPHYRFPEAAGRVLAAMARYAEWIQRPRTIVRTFTVDQQAAQAIVARVRQEGRRAMDQVESMELLRLYGFPVLACEVARTAEEVGRRAAQIGFPVAMKILSPDILHKVDVGGVRLGVKNAQEAEQVFRDMLAKVAVQCPDARLDGVLLQQMVSPGTETIIGMTRDRQFGPLVMFGLGGIYVEAYRDVTFRLAPIREFGAERMVRSIRAHKILEGFRGQPPADRLAVIECLERMSQLAVEIPEIAELDINPLIVYPHGQGAKVADARVLLT